MYFIKDKNKPLLKRTLFCFIKHMLYMVLNDWTVDVSSLTPWAQANTISNPREHAWQLQRNTCNMLPGLKNRCDHNKITFYRSRPTNCQCQQIGAKHSNFILSADFYFLRHLIWFSAEMLPLAPCYAENNVSECWYENHILSLPCCWYSFIHCLCWNTTFWCYGVPRIKVLSQSPCLNK